MSAAFKIVSLKRHWEQLFPQKRHWYKKTTTEKPTKKPQEKYQNLSEEERKENTRYDRQRYKKPPGNDERNVG